MYIRDLRGAYETARKNFQSLDFLGNVSGKAGRLDEDRNHYKAIFVFDPKDKRKSGELESFLLKKQYNAEFVIGNHITDSDTKLWKISLIANESLPSQQEESLIRSLNLLVDYLQKYSLNHLS